MQIEITRKYATTFMRWVIVLLLFGAVIYQSNRNDALQREIDSKDARIGSLYKDWSELNREYWTLQDSCKK
jgi:hypothetical protein